MIQLNRNIRYHLSTKETHMQYKTIVLQLMEQQPEVYNQLRKQRQLLQTLETYSDQLKALHEDWTETLSQANPGSDPIQIKSEALEMALEDLKDRLPTVTRQDGNEALSLDQAIASVRSHSSRD